MLIKYLIWRVTHFRKASMVLHVFNQLGKVFINMGDSPRFFVFSLLEGVTMMLLNQTWWIVTCIPIPRGTSQHALKGGWTFRLSGEGRGENMSSWRLGSKHLKRFKKSLELNRCTRPLPLQVYHRDQDCRETLLDHQLSRLEETQSCRAS